MSAQLLPCDGCGQPATGEHLVRRLKRLELTTRYRPVHIQTAFLSSVSPLDDRDFLYSGTEKRFAGEAETLLKAAGIQIDEKPPEAILAEFQRLGLFLAHVLECPAEPGSDVERLIALRLPVVMNRIRKSLKPKRIVLVSAALNAFAQQLHESGIPIEFGGQEAGSGP